MIRKTVAFVAAAAVLAACTTTIDPITANAPLKMAFTEPVATLEQRAGEGDRQAQYALSFLKKIGLRGVEADPVAVETLRASAGQAFTRTMPIYQPGVKGSAGTMIYVPITDPGISDADARRMDICGLMLLSGLPAMGGQVCGSPAAYADLVPGAIAARQDLMMSRTVVDPASVTRCDDVDALWSSAAVRFQNGAVDEAVAATDRIIELCGEAEPSWHARTMRALLALNDEDSDKAVALLAPIPRPAPAPIGGYVSFVAMAAQAQREDWPAYARERDTVIAASLAALKAEPNAKSVGRVVEGAVTVELIERTTMIHPGLTGLVVGIVQSTDPKSVPHAYWLTTSPDPMGGTKPVYFLDEYRCDGRSTFMYFPRGEDQPTVDVLKGLITQALHGELRPISGMAIQGPPTACTFPYFVAPGLGDDDSRSPQPSAPKVSSTPLP